MLRSRNVFSISPVYVHTFLSPVTDTIMVNCYNSNNYTNDLNLAVAILRGNVL